MKFNRFKYDAIRRSCNGVLSDFGCEDLIRSDKSVFNFFRRVDGFGSSRRRLIMHIQYNLLRYIFKLKYNFYKLFGLFISGAKWELKIHSC